MIGFFVHFTHQLSRQPGNIHGKKNTSTYISPTWRPSVNYLILTDSQPKLKTFTAVIVQLVTPYLISLSQRQRHQKKNNYITLTIVVS